MDRTLIYPGAIPQETDLLSAQVAAMTGVGYLLRSIFGTSTFVDGLQAYQAVPPSMNVNISEGSIGFLTQVDQTAFSSIPPASDALMKQGINTIPQALTFVAPTSPGQSQAFLIEAAFDEHDDTPLTIPYYNAANPALGFSGPNNSGVPQNRRRIQRVLLRVKPGVAASTGAQTIPSVDVGFVPLHVVTIANGATAITQAMIAQHPQSPALPWRLQQVGPTVPRIVAFLGTQIWTVPPGVFLVRCTGLGGGGAGGGTAPTAAGQISIAPGGNSGTVFYGTYPVRPYDTISIVIGAGGTWSGGIGNDGGTTAFGGFASAPGGHGAGGITPAFAPPYTASPTVPSYSSFGGAGGYLGVPERQGGSAMAQSTVSFLSGRGADNVYGTGGPCAGIGSISNNGSSGMGYGAGGSGAATGPSGGAQIGGNGAPGILVLEY